MSPNEKHFFMSCHRVELMKLVELKTPFISPFEAILGMKFAFVLMKLRVDVYRMLQHVMFTVF
jgi:hypothetical protein